MLRALLLVALLGACSAPRTSATFGDWTYAVTVEGGGERLEVVATFPPGDELQLAVAPSTRAFVELVRADTGDPTETPDGSWRFAASTEPRSARWRFRASEAGRAIDDSSLAAWRGQGFVGSLATFLPFETDGAHGSRVFLTFSGADGIDFACGWRRDGAAWTGAPEDVVERPVCALGRIAVERIAPLESGGLEVVFVRMEPSARSEGNDRAAELRAWVTTCARAVEALVGRFPVENVLLVLTPNGRPGLAGGRAEGNGHGGAAIWIAVGARTSAQQLHDDWILTHEMIHLALPSLPRRHHWLEEGSATYLEPIARARAGLVAEDDVWAEWLRDYGQGLPTADDRGLDLDSSWGRTYYGGAIFCLLADAEIRARTGNRRSLADAFAAIVAAGGQISDRWPLDRLLEVADQGTGTSVLSELYARQRASPEPRELESTWARLGVRLEKGRVRYDDAAPWAAVRRDLVLGGLDGKGAEAGHAARRTP